MGPACCRAALWPPKPAHSAWSHRVGCGTGICRDSPQWRPRLQTPTWAGGGGRRSMLVVQSLVLGEMWKLAHSLMQLSSGFTLLPPPTPTHRASFKPKYIPTGPIGSRSKSCLCCAIRSSSFTARGPPKASACVEGSALRALVFLRGIPVCACLAFQLGYT